MGFRPEKKVFRLKFEDSELEGLEVMAGGTTTGEMLDLQDAEKGQVAFAIEMLGKRLISWNLEEEDGTPVPANADGLRSQDPDFVRAIIAAWTEAIGGVEAPLRAGSDSGETSLAASIPMEPLSQSRAS
jgi:hypothetical protein